MQWRESHTNVTVTIRQVVNDISLTKPPDQTKVLVPGQRCNINTYVWTVSVSVDMAYAGSHFARNLYLHWLGQYPYWTGSIVRRSPGVLGVNDFIVY